MPLTIRTAKLGPLFGKAQRSGDNEQGRAGHESNGRHAVSSNRLDTRPIYREEGQAPFLRSILRAVPAKAAGPLLTYTIIGNPFAKASPLGVF
jgi:hypothetical protein